MVKKSLELGGRPTYRKRGIKRNDKGLESTRLLDFLYTEKDGDEDAAGSGFSGSVGSLKKLDRSRSRKYLKGNPERGQKNKKVLSKGKKSLVKAKSSERKTTTKEKSDMEEFNLYTHKTLDVTSYLKYSNPVMLGTKPLTPGLKIVPINTMLQEKQSPRQKLEWGVKSRSKKRSITFNT